MTDFKLPASLEFTADQIRRWPHVDGVDDTYECIARHCNTLLTERLAKLVTVYSCDVHPGRVCGTWARNNHPVAKNTHATKILPPWEIEK